MNARVKYPMLSRHPCSFHIQLQVNRTAGAPKVEPSSGLLDEFGASQHFSIFTDLFPLLSGIWIPGNHFR